jgi:hypothetical protein
LRARQVKADGISYTESGTASGSIGAEGFTNALVTITFVGDTSNVQSLAPGVFINSVETVTASGSIDGVGAFTFTDSLAAFVNQFGTPGSTAGISDLTLNEILDTVNSSVLATYGLTTAIGPVTDTSIFNPGSSYGTSDGN